VQIKICKKKSFRQRLEISDGIMVNTNGKTPEEVLYSHNLFSAVSNQLIRPQMENFEFVNIKTAIEDKIQRANWIFAKSLENHDRANEDDLKAQFSRLAATFVFNSCSEETIKLYGEELCAFVEAEDRLKFLSSFYATETKTEKIRRYKEKLDKLARQKNEKFELFFSKINSIAEQITDKADAREYIIDVKFRQILSPETESFLRDMCMLGKTPKEIACFLDQRERNVSIPKIAQLQIDDKIDTFVQSTSDMFAKTSIAFEEQIARMEDKHKKSEDLAEQRAKILNNQIENLTATIAKLTFERNQPLARPQFQSQAQQGQTNGQNSFQPRPRFCHYCKTDAHYRSQCPHITCHACGSKGHMRNRCPTSQKPAQVPSATQPADLQTQRTNLNA